MLSKLQSVVYLLGSLFILLLIASISYHWLLGDKTFLQPRGGTMNALY